MSCLLAEEGFSLQLASCHLAVVAVAFARRVAEFSLRSACVRRVVVAPAAAVAAVVAVCNHPSGFFRLTVAVAVAAPPVEAAAVVPVRRAVVCNLPPVCFRRGLAADRVG